jgi:GntR family transcriptional regulator, rspAB operon transcriptional repressor
MRKEVESLLNEQVYDILRGRIIERQLPPGTKLDLAAIQAELAVSRMPVVDALRRLEIEGLVTVRNRVGSFVIPLSATLYEEIFETRNMIEYWVTPKIILHISNNDIEELRNLLAETAHLVSGVTEATFDYRSFIRCDEQFHLRLIRLCKNSHIIGAYRSLNTHMQTARAYSLRALARSRDGQQEHEAILDAFAQRDVEGARAAQRHHAERSRAGVLALLQQYGEL